MAQSIQAGLADHPDSDRVAVVLASPDPEGMVRDFLAEHHVALPTLLDDAGVYRRYDRDALGETHAPYPLHVVVDGDGTIRHLSTDSDPDAIVATLRSLLDAG